MRSSLSVKIANFRQLRQERHSAADAPSELVWELTTYDGVATVIRSPAVQPITAVLPGDSSATVQV